MPLRAESNQGRLSSGLRANVNVGAMRSLRRVVCLASVGIWIGCSVNQAGLTDGDVPPDAGAGTAGVGGAGSAGRGGGGGTAGSVLAGARWHQQRRQRWRRGIERRRGAGRIGRRRCRNGRYGGQHRDRRNDRPRRSGRNDRPRRHGWLERCRRYRRLDGPRRNKRQRRAWPAAAARPASPEQAAPAARRQRGTAAPPARGPAGAGGRGGTGGAAGAGGSAGAAAPARPRWRRRARRQRRQSVRGLPVDGPSRSSRRPTIACTATGRAPARRPGARRRSPACCRTATW